MLRSAALLTASLAALTAAAAIAPATATASAGASDRTSGPRTPLRLATRRAPPTHLLLDLVERERRAVDLPPVLRAGHFGVVPRPPTIGIAPPSLDAVHAKHEITLDETTGVVSAVLDLKVRANGKDLAAVGLAFDKGLTVSSATAPSRSATLSDEIYGDDMVTMITLDPPLASGQETTLRVVYAGTLACSSTAGAAACAKGRPFSYFAHGSVIPFIYDPNDQLNQKIDSLTREIIVKVPEGSDVFVTGERASETVATGTRTSTWLIDRPLAKHLGLYILAGKIGQLTVPGRTTPTTLLYQAPEKPVDARLVTWSGPVLDFVETMAGSPLPFQRSQSLVRLPSDLGDPGTATFGMTLLSESYANAGEVLHEETWVHENAHLFWGIVAPDTDPNQSRLLSEGLAVITQLEYSHRAHFAGEDRDAYFARRFLPMGLDMRLNGPKTPSPKLPAGKSMTSTFGTPQYTLWAYYKTAATLDHLRATMGDTVFEKGLADYAKACSFAGCTIEAFRAFLEESSGMSLASFFTRWVDGTERPQVTVAFTPTAAGADVTLTKADDAPMRVELFVTLEDGTRTRTHADLTARTTTVATSAAGPVRSVALNPRHDLMIDAQSAAPGDLDFDGEVDGLDILRCARQVGATYDSGGGSGLWTLDETFDPRCDVDANLKIDDDDVAILSETFGTLRAR